VKTDNSSFPPFFVGQISVPLNRTELVYDSVAANIDSWGPG